MKAARLLNDQMPDNFVKMLVDAAGNLQNKEILILGVTYRPQVKEIAYSGAFELQKILTTLGAQPKFHDPLITEVELMDLGLAPGEINDQTEIIIIHTDHKEYSELDFQNMPNLKFVVDGRGVLGQGFRVIRY